MKNVFFLFFSFSVFLSFSSDLHAQIDGAFDMIAHFPLTTNGNDETGNHTEMTLINAPLSADGAYSNGIYSGGGDTTACTIETPTLTQWDLATLGFAVSVEFKIEEIPSLSTPVIIAGGSWRHLGIIYEPDGTFSLNVNSTIYTSTTPYTLNTWMEGHVIFNVSTNEALLYIDGNMAQSQTVTVLEHHNERDISNTHYGLGQTFKGNMRNLKAYNRIHAVGISSMSSLAESLNFSSTPSAIGVSTNKSGLFEFSIVDISGKELYRSAKSRMID